MDWKVGYTMNVTVYDHNLSQRHPGHSGNRRRKPLRSQLSATLANVDEEAEAFTYLEQENHPCFCLARKNNNHASVHYRPRLPPGRYFFA